MELTPKDRELRDRLMAAIADPTTSAEDRAELNDELATLLHDHVIAEQLGESMGERPECPPDIERRLDDPNDPRDW